ncbi:MAG: DUF6089 family protein [Flammeovirgaceae bacterium]
MKKFTLILSLLLLAVTVFSQKRYSARRGGPATILSVGTGTSTYYGELANPGVYDNANLNLNIGLQYAFANRFAARVELNWFQLNGDDAQAPLESGRKTRNLSFQSNNIELSAVGMVNLFSNGDRVYRRPSYNLYGFIGVGVLSFNPKGKDLATGQMVDLQPLKTEGVDYSKLTLAIPYGIGGRVKISPQLNLAAEIGWRKLFTDYIDDVSTTYPDPTSFTSALALRMSDKRDQSVTYTQNVRGNPSDNDAYMLLNVKLEYYLNSSKSRRSIKYRRSSRR